MNHDRLIRVTNRVAVFATFALFYWVFVFLIITAFDLKIFKEYMTQIFYLSLLSIFAILGGAIVLNVMSNLSKISTLLSEQRGNNAQIQKLSRTTLIAIALSFPLLCGLLFAGNTLSAEKKKNMLIAAAQTLISENQTELASLSDYEFSKEYVKKAEKTLAVIKKIDKYFPEVVLILPDDIDKKRVFLGFGTREYFYDKDEVVEKPKFIYSASHDERLYLDRAFSGQEKNYKFSYRQGNYELYFPVQINGKNMVLFFSDYQQYGKFGS
ncbi:MAG: hypothetical protein HZC48_07645 [Nitrospirae bacterium]|nr:hypothetical protein [Nitrospirota bacterium]